MEFLCRDSVHAVSLLFDQPKNARVVCCSPEEKDESSPVGVRLPSDGKRSGLLIRCSAQEVCDLDSAPIDANASFEEIDWEDSELGKRAPTEIPEPLQLSREEVDEHDLTHLPFRSWCRHCVRGKGRAADHTGSVREDGLPELHLDYCFMKSEVAEMKTILVLPDGDSTAG